MPSGVQVRSIKTHGMTSPVRHGDAIGQTEITQRKLVKNRGGVVGQKEQRSSVCRQRTRPAGTTCNRVTDYVCTRQGIVRVNLSNHHLGGAVEHYIELVLNRRVNYALRTIVKAVIRPRVVVPIRQISKVVEPNKLCGRRPCRGKKFILAQYSTVNVIFTRIQCNCFVFRLD